MVIKNLNFSYDFFERNLIFYIDSDFGRALKMILWKMFSHEESTGIYARYLWLLDNPEILVRLVL